MRWCLGDDAPSVRKPFSSDPRGCLGVPDPPAAAPPLEKRVRLAASVCGRSGPSRAAPALRGRAANTRGFCCLCPPPLLPVLPAPPPSESGEGPAGPGLGAGAGAGVRRGESAALRCVLRARACSRVARREKKRGFWLGARKPFRSRTHAPSPLGGARPPHAPPGGRLSVRSRSEFADDGSVCGVPRGHGSGFRAGPRRGGGASRPPPRVRAPPLPRPPRPGRTGRDGIG